MPTRAASAIKADTEGGGGRATRSRTNIANGVAASGGAEKENANAKQPATKSTGKAAVVAKELYCICRGEDDGRPMVQCGHCQDW
jgi:hypothetical protein